MRRDKKIDTECIHCKNHFLAPTKGKVYCGIVCLRGAYYQRNKFRLAEIRITKKALEVNINL